jgi:hypothetical protein
MYGFFFPKKVHYFVGHSLNIALLQSVSSRKLWGGIFTKSDCVLCHYRFREGAARLAEGWRRGRPQPVCRPRQPQHRDGGQPRLALLIDLLLRGVPAHRPAHGAAPCGQDYKLHLSPVLKTKLYSRSWIVWSLIFFSLNKLASLGWALKVPEHGCILRAGSLDIGDVFAKHVSPLMFLNTTYVHISTFFHKYAVF